MKSFILLNTVVASLALGVCAGGTAQAANTWRPSADVRYPQPGPVAGPVSQPRISVELFGNNAFAKGEGFHLFSNGKQIDGGGLAASFRVLNAEKVSLAARLELSDENSRGLSYQGDTKYRASSFAGGFTLDVAAHKYLRPYLQLTAGRATAQVDLYGVGNSDLRGEDSVLFGTGAAGVRFMTPAKSWWTGGRGIAFSVFLEGGYTVSPEFKFDLKTTADTNKDDIPLGTVALGALPHSRAHSRLGVAVHF
jgi:hypothetical protein